MNDLSLQTLALKIAEALLLYKGEISLEDIKAMPFLDNPKDAEQIASFLSNKFKTQIHTKKIVRTGIADWEELITLTK
jgi:hypothetical protein